MQSHPIILDCLGSMPSQNLLNPNVDPEWASNMQKMCQQHPEQNWSILFADLSIDPLPNHPRP